MTEQRVEQSRYEDAKKSDAVKERDRKQIEPLIKAMFGSDKTCPKCHGKGMYYRDIMLNVAICECRYRRMP